MNDQIKKEIRNHIKKIMLEYTDSNGKRSVRSFCKAKGLNYTNVVRFFNGSDIKLLRLFKAVLPAYNWPDNLGSITVDCFIDLMLNPDIPYYWEGLFFSTKTGNLHHEKRASTNNGTESTVTDFLQVIGDKDRLIQELREENKRLKHKIHSSTVLTVK